MSRLERLDILKHGRGERVMGGGPPPMCLEVLILVGEREERELRDPEELRSLRQREKPWKREMRGQSNRTTSSLS
jgi:hypothetical protein